MENEVIQSMFYIGLIYIISMCMLIPLFIYYRTHRRNPIDMRWAVVLGSIIMLTVLVGAFEGGLASCL